MSVAIFHAVAVSDVLSLLLVVVIVVVAVPPDRRYWWTLLCYVLLFSELQQTSESAGRTSLELLALFKQKDAGAICNDVCLFYQEFAKFSNSECRPYVINPFNPTTDQLSFSPQCLKWNTMQKKEENVWTDEALVKPLIDNLFLPVEMTESVWANVRRIWVLSLGMKGLVKSLPTAPQPLSL